MVESSASINQESYVLRTLKEKECIPDSLQLAAEMSITHENLDKVLKSLVAD